MAIRGRKPGGPAAQAMAGETRPSRTGTVTVLFPDHASRPDPEELKPPKWMAAAARKIWDEKVNRYRQRGQKISGFEDSLAQYCALEAELIDMRKKRMVPPMAMVSQHRVWASEFYDTPASQVARPGSKPAAGSRFNANGQRPS